MNSIKYSLTFINKSYNQGSVCIYQTNRNLQQDVLSLAWITKRVNPSTSVTFQWSLDYGFFWCETGELQSGAIFRAYQVWLADEEYNNSVTYKYIDDAFTFDNLTHRDNNGVFYIKQDHTIPHKTSSVGISVAGSGAFVTQAQPNLTLMFKLNPEYWITFGNYSQGEVLNLTEIYNKQKLNFSLNMHNICATLNQDNLWTISNI